MTALSRVSLWAGPDLTADTLSSALNLGIETVHLFSGWKRALELVARTPTAKVVLTVGDGGFGNLQAELKSALSVLSRQSVETLLLFYPEAENFTTPEPFDFLRAQRGRTAATVGLMARDEGTALLTRRLELDLVCLHHNWFRREQAIEFFPIARSQDIPVLAADVLRGSRLSSPEVARLHGYFPGLSLARLALGYVLHESCVASASVEVSSPEELESCLPVAELSEQQAETIERVLLGLAAK